METNDQKAADMLLLEQCRELLFTLSVMQKNLNLIQVGSGKTITVAGGNLYQIASEQYGDPSQWALIAKANGMVDPIITGVKTLLIPPLNGQDTGGVLNA